MAQDLAYTLIASFGISFMGIIVYFHDYKSVTNRLFFLMSLSTLFWAFANYFSLRADAEELVLRVRTVLFFAAPHAVLFLAFLYNFPSRTLKINKAVFAIMILALILTMGATLSPFVFLDSQNGSVPVPGPLMPLFSVVVLGSLVGGILIIFKKYLSAREIERTQWKYMLVGVLTSYVLLITTNFVVVVAFSNNYFVKFGPLFMLPAIFGMGYAILKHRLLNVKTITTEIFTFVILSISLFEVFVADGLEELILRLAIFGAFFFFGVFLMRSVLREVEQREKLEVLTKELESANERLKELDHLKSEFLSFASHQIKAPLAGIKGFATLIYDGTYGEVPEKVKDAAHKIKDSADRMVHLVTDSLNIRKIEEGKMNYKFERIDVCDMVRSIFDELKTLAENKKLEFTLESTLKVCWVNADIQNIRQVFQNLMENAIKYTDSGFVKVRLETYGNKFLFSVSDSGRGISAELLPHLFEEFRREAATQNQNIEGTGLGLYIAKEIVDAHHGEIWIESDGLGKGSKFLVRLSLA